MNIKTFFKASGVLIKSRLPLIFTWTWGTAVPCLVVGKGFPPLIPTFKAIFSVMFLSMSVYIYNDLIDLKLDQKNAIKKDRPLVIGKVLTTDAMNFVYLTSVLGLAIGASLNIRAFSFIMLWYVLLLLYSYPPIHLKTKFMMKELIIMSGNVITAVAASYAVAGQIVSLALYTGGMAATLCIVSMPALWDTSDMEADRLQGVKTLAMVMSWRMKMGLLYFGMFFMMAVTQLLYSGLGFNIMMPLAVIIGGLITLGYVAPLLKGYDEARIVNSKKMILIFNMTTQLVSIFAIMNLPF